MEALIFDLDDTLVVDEASAAAAFLKTCLYAQAHYGINLPGFYETIREVCRAYWYQSPARAYCMEIGISSREGLWAEFTGEDENLRILRNWAPTYRKLTWTTLLRKFGIDDEAFALELADVYIAKRRELHVVYRDVEPALASLKSAYRFGLLTNGAPDLQRRKIEATGLGDYFKSIVISGEEGVGKPDRRLFKTILTRLRVNPENALMVGDSLKSDIRGAHEVGMKAVWVNRGGEKSAGGITPDLIIRDLGEVKQALESGAL